MAGVDIVCPYFCNTSIVLLDLGTLLVLFILSTATFDVNVNSTKVGFLKRQMYHIYQ